MANSGENIDLGSFDWDTSKIEQKVALNTQEQQRLAAQIKATKDMVKQQSKEIADLEKIIESETKAQEDLNKKLQQGTITQEAYSEELAKSNELLEASIQEQQSLAQAQAQAILVTNRQERAVKDLREENSELNRLLRAGREDIQENENAYRDLNKELNALKTEAKNLGAQMVIMEREGNNTGEAYEQLKKRWEEASAEADKLNADFKRLDKAIGDNQRTVGDYRDQIKNAFSDMTVGFNQLLSGQVQEGFDTIKDGFKNAISGAKQLAVTLAANPLLLAATAIIAIGAGIAAGVNEIFKYNEAIAPAIKLTEQLTGLSDKAADSVRIRAQSLADTFDGEFSEILKTANALSSQLGISFDEAFDKIQAGYVRGADASGDFLERLREYAPLLQKFGFDLDEIIGLQIQAQQAGIFNDKFEDSLKEAGLSLTEFTKAQADALTNAFGRDFGDKIFNAVNSGAMTVKDSLLLIGSEAKKQGLSVQQTAQLTADVFKGAGEDAGGALTIFQNLYEGINKLDEPLTKTQELTMKLASANNDLATAKDNALKSDSVMAFQKNLEIFWVKAQTIFYGFVESLGDAMSWIDEVTGASDSLVDTWNALVSFAGDIGEAIDAVVDVFSDLFDALGLNSEGTKGMASEFFRAINPLNIFKTVLAGVSAAVRSFSNFIEANRVNISAFAITVKSVLKQIGDAVKGFDITDPLASLEKLKNIDIASTYKNATKEAQKLVEANKALKNQGDPSLSKNVDPGVKTNKTGGINPNDALRDKEAKAAEAARSKAQKDAEKAAADATKLLEEESKKSIEIERQRALNASAIAKSELAEYISMNAEKYRDDKRLTHAKLQEQLDYFEEVKKQQQQLNALEQESAEKAVQVKLDEINKKEQAGKVLTENEINERLSLNEQLEVIVAEYQNRDLALETEALTKKKEANQAYLTAISEQRTLHDALMYQQKILALENEQNQEIAIQRATLDYQTQAELEEFLKKNNLKRLSDEENYTVDQEIILQRKEIQSQIDAEDDVNEKMRLQNQLDGMAVIQQNAALKQKQIDKTVQDAKVDAFASAFGSISKLLGEGTAAGKAAAVAETTMNTYKAATAAYAAGASLGGPLGAVMGPVLAGLAVASGIQNVKKIIATKADTKGGNFYDGGFTGFGGKYEPRGTVHAGEIVWSQDDIKRAGGVAVAEAMRPTSATYTSGGVAGSYLSNVQNSVSDSEKTLSLSEDAVGQIAGAIYEGSQKGIGDMADNRSVQENSNF